MFDLLIRAARLVDGTGSPWRHADVGVGDGRIVEVGNLRGASASAVIDADGRYLCPGFIDIHTHSDFGLMVEPTAECAVRQGVTTHVIGNCGTSAAPYAAEFAEPYQRLNLVGVAGEITWRSYAEYLAAMQAQGVGVNVAPLVGHGTVRLAVLGADTRAPSDAELDEMREHVDEAMKAGCFGLSSGLVYPPGCFGDTDEVAALAEVAGRHGGMYASHIRGERETVLEAINECIEIGERGGCRIQISHNAPKFGGTRLLPDAMELWRAARERGLDVTVDNDGHTDLGVLLREALPQWTHDLPLEELLGLLSDPDRRAQLRAEIKEDRVPGWGPSGLLVHEAFDRMTMLRTPRNPGNAGRTVAALAAERGSDPWDTYFDVIVEERNEAIALFDYIETDTVKALLRDPLVMICSDGWVLPKESRTAEPPPYVPCSYGEYPGVIERFVVNEQVISLEEMVRKSSSMPAAKLGLVDRGVVRPGMAADLVLLDLPRVHDRATDLWPHSAPFENYPHDFPDGIDWVWVNGIAAVADGASTGSLSGTVLRANGANA